MTQVTYYICVHDGDMIGVDADSGGYPWRVKHLANVRFWLSRDEAQIYADIWNNPMNASYGYSGMAVKEFHYELR